MKREITPAQIKAVGKYERDHYDKILLRIPHGERDNIKAAADRAGESLNAYIIKAIEERTQKELP